MKIGTKYRANGCNIGPLNPLFDTLGNAIGNIFQGNLTAFLKGHNITTHEMDGSTSTLHLKM